MYNTEPIGWDKLNELGREYHQLVQVGYGGSLGTRCQRQIEIAGIVSTNLTKYVYKIARQIVNHGVQINVQGQTRVLSLKGSRISIDDLVQEGYIGVIKGLQTFDPEKGGISTHLKINIASKMYGESPKMSGLTRLPTKVYDEAKKISGETISSKGALHGIISSIRIKGKQPNYHQALAIYYGVKKKWVDINGPIGTDPHSPGDDTFENRFLEDEEALTVDEQAEMNDLVEQTKKILRTLNSQEKKVLSMVFGIGIEEEHTLVEVSETLKATTDRIRQIHAIALRKLRHPSRIKFVKDYI